MDKKIESISSETMEWLIRYPWPGNIRELQNAIERSVVLYTKGSLKVRTGSISAKPFHRPSVMQVAFRKSEAEDRRMIDAALTETEGRVSGPTGAAAILGIPASTLESKIRSLNIDKYSFKSSRDSSRTSRIREVTQAL
jgi:DNA-binding NtrC family response regulator